MAADEASTVQPTSVNTKKLFNSQALEPKSATGSDVMDNTFTLGHMEVEVVRTSPTPSLNPASFRLVPSHTSSLDPSPMETTSTSSGEGGAETLGTSKPTPISFGKGQPHPSILVESLKQLTPLLSVTSRVGRSLADLMNLLVRLSTCPHQRSFRRGGHTVTAHGYLETSKDAITVCMEITNLLSDSLLWEVPMPHSCSSAMQSPIRDWLFAG